MNYHRPDTILNILILFNIIIFGDCNQLNPQFRRGHLQNQKFGDKDYLDYSETDERLDQDASSTRNEAPFMNTQSLGTISDSGQNSINFSYSLDSHIKWDKNWLQNLQLGQLSAVDVDQNGNIAIFCRRNRPWESSLFGPDNKYDPKIPIIDENVIFLFDKYGNKLSEWGKNIFYLPHGLTIDFNGNYWLTDVAMHQVFKFDKLQIDQYLEKMKTKRKNHSNEITLVPSLVLGVAFEPGNDDKSFCKPTAVAVAKNGDFFVSDGYCNSRVIKFNSKGEKILQFGRSLQPGFYKTLPVYSFFIPHALALAEELGIIFVADRENGRILSYHEQNGTFYKEYKHPAMGIKIFSIAYANKRLYAVNGHAMIGIADRFHVHGYVIDINSTEILSQFGPDGDMLAPHDIAVTKDASEIYVVELTISKAYRFIQESIIAPDGKNQVQKVESISYNETQDRINSTKTALLFFAGAVLITGLCVAVAAIMAKCRKRGCLLTVRRKAYWETEKKDNFKLSSLLESRQGKGLRIFGNRPNTRDFSKLNTEPESSEDDLVQDSITI